MAHFVISCEAAGGRDSSERMCNLASGGITISLSKYVSISPLPSLDLHSFSLSHSSCFSLNTMILCLHYSCFLYQLIKGSKTTPDNPTISSWVQANNKQYGVNLIPTPLVIKSLIRRANYLKIKVPKVRGGRQQKEFLDKNWILQVRIK